MTSVEAAKIVGILRIAYPDLYRGLPDAERRETVRLWSVMFCDDDYQLVQAAVKHYIATDAKQYRPPHIGAIKEALSQIQRPGRRTGEEAWTLVCKALGNSLYHAGEEFDALPEEIQRLVGSASQLREWAMMDCAVVQSVVASNFQRAYRARAQEERDWAKLPADLRDFAGRRREALRMPGPLEVGEGSPTPCAARFG